MISRQTQHQDPGGPVLRTADRMRLEGCVNALTKEGLNLALQCPHEALLDHYASLLLDRLQADNPRHQLEIYFPSNTESLIQKFNDVLSDQNVSDATRPARDAQALRIWVIHDAQKVSTSEMQLLARLIHNFPGAQIRALLLFHQPDHDPQVLASFGRKLLRWDLELPSPAQAMDALELALSEGRQAQMAQLLRRIGCSPDATTPLSLGLEARQQAQELSKRRPRSVRLSAVHLAMNRILEALQQALAGVRQVQMPSWPSSQPGSKRLAFGVGVALMASLALVAWIQPQSNDLRKPSSIATPVESAVPAQLRGGTANDVQQKQGPIGLFRSSYGARS